MHNGKETPDFLDQMVSSAAAEPVETPETELEPATPEALEPTGVTEPVTPAAEATPAPKEPDKTVPLAALMAEREKRQQFERELQALREQPQPEVTDFYANPTQHIQEVVAIAEQSAQQRIFAALEAAAKQRYTDYDDMMTLVLSEAQQTPAIRSQILNAADPAEAAYRMGQRLKRLLEPETSWEQKERELRAKWEAELADKASKTEAALVAKVEKANAIPPDIGPNAPSNTRAREKDIFKTLFDKP